MAFTLEVIRGSTTYNISAGQPIALESLDDLGGASVRNLEESGPYQDGASHLGERLEPRTMTLRLNVVGSSASALDGHRDTLNAMFKPVRGVPITLKVTRDDGEIRQIDTRRTGPLAIPLHKENKPGNLHRAVVQLRAVDPTFYDPTEEEETFLGPTDWYLAFNTIGTANVLAHAESPGTNTAISLSSTVNDGGAWTVALRTLRSSSSGRTMFQFPSGANIAGVGTTSLRAQHIKNAGGNMLHDFSYAAGTVSYMVSASGSAGTVYVDNALPTPLNLNPSPGTSTLALAAGGKWRSGTAGANAWDNEMPFAAVYNIVLSSTQRAALDKAMADGGSAYSVPVVYEGDFDSYPVITITGPLANPVITNTTTGDTLDFTGGTVGSAEIWTIDTRYGRKSVLLGTVSKASYLSNDSDLATFRLVADPLATGGTNIITVGGSASGSATITLSYYNRYMSF